MSRFPSAGHRSPAGSRHGNKWLAAMRVEAASSVSRTKNTYLGAQYARIAERRGSKWAAVAVAHSMLVSAYHMLDWDEPYRDLGVTWLEQRHRDTHTRRLVAQLQRLGHVVVLNPEAKPLTAKAELSAPKL